MSIKMERLKKILKTKAYKDFLKFMVGQTCDVNGIYEDDFLRWVKENKEFFD